MTWHQYLFAQCIATLLLLYFYREMFTGKLWRLLRLTGGAAALSFFVDYPAEDRTIWTFEFQPLAFLMEVPIENILLICSSIPFILIIHLRWKQRRDRKLERSKNPTR